MFGRNNNILTKEIFPKFTLKMYSNANNWATEEKWHDIITLTVSPDV